MELVLFITQFVIHFLSDDFYDFGKYPLIYAVKPVKPVKRGKKPTARKNKGIS